MKRKASKFDFKESSLPSNRKELFFDIIRNNFRVLMKIGLVLILFSIPLIITLIWRDFIDSSFLSSYTNGAILEDEFLNLITINNLLFNAINMVCLGIIGIGIAGIMKIVKRLCFLDPVFFIEDFKAGIKDSGKHMFFLFFILGFILLINSYSSTNASNQIIMVIPVSISFAIVFPTFIIMIMALAIYNLKFGQAFYVSFMLYIKSALKTLLAYIIFLIPFTCLFIPNVVIRYGMLLVVFLVVMPIILVGMFDYCCSIFDKHINQLQYPEIYRKGLINLINKDNNK